MRLHPNLAPLLQPGSIAVVGASADLNRIGGLPIKLLIESGFARFYPVNPKYSHIEGHPCFPTIEAIPDQIDLVIIATAAADVLGQLERAHRKGVKAAIVFAAGFAESGEPGGADMQAALTRFAQDSGMVINGPNSIGVINWTQGVFATFARAFPPERPAGRIALLGQSGNISSTIYRIARRVGLSFSHVISTGNEACLNISDYLAYLAEDKNTDAVLCYLEALRDGPGFVRAALRMRELGKLLVVFKAGTSEKGAEAARSHTAALAGDRVAYETAFRSAGVAVAEDLGHLVELTYMHRFAARGLGPGVGIVSVSGAAGTILSDALSAGGMGIPDLSASVQAQLKAVMPAFGAAANPVDLTGNISHHIEAAGIVLDLVLSAEPVDVLVVYAGGRVLSACLSTLARLARETSNLIVVIDTFESGLRDEIEAMGVAFFDEIAPAVRALTSYHAWKRAEPDRPSPASPALEAAVVMFRELAARSAGGALNEMASKAILAAAGLKVVGGGVATSVAAAIEAAEAIGYPVALKVVSADIPHKTELGAVKLDLRTADAVEGAYHEIERSLAALAPDARIEGMAVESFVTGGRELLVGVERDPVFGWLMTVGCGGVWVEVFKDVSHALLPVDEAKAEAMLRELKSFPLLDGFRGSAGADLPAACRAIARLSDLALNLGDALQGCEINPLLVLPAGGGAIVADALVRLRGRRDL